MEDVALARIQIFLRIVQIHPSAFTLRSSDGTIVVTEDEFHAIATHYVLLLHLEREAEEVPSVGFYRYVDIESFGIEVGVGYDGSPVLAVALYVYVVGILIALAGFVRHDDATSGVYVDVRLAGEAVVERKLLVQIEVLIWLVKLLQLSELTPLGIPIVVVAGLQRDIQSGRCICGFVKSCLGYIHRLYGIGINSL